MIASAYLAAEALGELKMALQLLQTAESRPSGFRCTSTYAYFQENPPALLCLPEIAELIPDCPAPILAPHHHIRTCGTRTRVLLAPRLICRLTWATGHTYETLPS